mmetsp:Transcript_14416/g.39708  ORF Transcript_14416/g.39708 Transcript_14416/m.39708 type:complete len:171 (+) Transcript_14416:208-720(+)
MMTTNYSTATAIPNICNAENEPATCFASCSAVFVCLCSCPSSSPCCISAPWEVTNQLGDDFPDVLTPPPTASPFDYTYLFDADEAVPFWNATTTKMYRGMWDEVWCEDLCRRQERPMVGYVYIFVGDVYDVTNCVCYYDAMPTCLQRQPQILDQPSVMRSNEPIPNVTCS